MNEAIGVYNMHWTDTFHAWGVSLVDIDDEEIPNSRFKEYDGLRMTPTIKNEASVPWYGHIGEWQYMLDVS